MKFEDKKILTMTAEDEAERKFLQRFLQHGKSRMATGDSKLTILELKDGVLKVGSVYEWQHSPGWTK